MEFHKSAVVAGKVREKVKQSVKCCLWKVIYYDNILRRNREILTP